MIPPAVVWDVPTFSPAPTRKIAKVYRRLGVRVDRTDPDVTVQAAPIDLPDGVTTGPGLDATVVTATYLWRDDRLVVVGPTATKWQIAAALWDVGAR